MSDTNNPFYTDEEWIQYYQETPSNPSAPVVVCGSYEHGTTIMTGFTTGKTSSASIVSGGGGGVINSGNNSPLQSLLKPVRRRSRASKRTPITLLDASATNFRALVQQFTGCPRETGGMSLGRQKGPVNLSFERNDYVLTESSKSTYPSYDKQGLTQTLPQQQQLSQGRISMQRGVGNIFGETTSQENVTIDESYFF